mgnify:CR=1 FL=1
MKVNYLGHSTFLLTIDGVKVLIDPFISPNELAKNIDIQQIEVLRDPQGSLFGKNTTAGAFNITTREASFTPSASFELSYGNYGYIQAKGSISGPINKQLAARLSFSVAKPNWNAKINKQ